MARRPIPELITIALQDSVLIRGVLHVDTVYIRLALDVANVNILCFAWPLTAPRPYHRVANRSHAGIQIRGFHGTDPATIDREIAKIVRKVRRIATAGEGAASKD